MASSQYSRLDHDGPKSFESEKTLLAQPNRETEKFKTGFIVWRTKGFFSYGVWQLSRCCATLTPTVRKRNHLTRKMKMAMTTQSSLIVFRKAVKCGLTGVIHVTGASLGPHSHVRRCSVRRAR
mmetsp:Transcript_8504/g.10011  ORF Transcript_8504/g.10011 Transcript_8504/m.10011 type:complete len:123 (-) Transcript_8504:90-458(-)